MLTVFIRSHVFVSLFFLGGVGFVFVTVVVVVFLFSFSLFSDLREDSCNRFPKRVSR